MGDFREAEENVRRLVGVIATAALAAALIFGVAAASSLAPGDGPAFDLRAQLMLRLFGESSDTRASLAAAFGDRASESPLRDLALGAPNPDETTPLAPQALTATFALPRSGRSAPAPADSAFALGQAARNRLFEADRFVAPLQTNGDTTPGVADASRLSSVQTFTVGQYQPVAPVTPVSPQSVAFSFAPVTLGASSGLPERLALAFGGSTAVPAGAAGSSAYVPTAVHLGPLQFTTRLESASLAAPTLSLNDNAYGAGANFNVRAGARNVNVDLSSNYERLTRNDVTGSSSAVGTSSWLLPSASAPLLVPNYADLSKVSVGAALAVPVVNGLTLNLNYAADRMFGGYGAPGLANLDATDNSYGGQLTFQIPHSSSTLSISARQLRYQDNLIPANTSTQTREDVNFTVKF
jgi:hypothetical protein